MKSAIKLLIYANLFSHIVFIEFYFKSYTPPKVQVYHPRDGKLTPYTPLFFCAYHRWCTPSMVGFFFFGYTLFTRLLFWQMS